MTIMERTPERLIDRVYMERTPERPIDRVYMERTPERPIDRVYMESCLREEGYRMPAYHCHPYYELFHVEHGTCRFFAENTFYDLDAGGFLLIPPQVLHSTRYPAGPCRRFAIFFRREDISETVSSLLPRSGEFFSEIQAFQVRDAYREQFSSLLLRMAAEERVCDRSSEAMLYLQLQELFLLCGRQCVFLQDTPVNIHTTDQGIVLAVNYICGNYKNPVTTADIAAAAGFSPNYLTRKFRAAVGIGVHQYLIYVRLKHAALELLSTRDGITEIAVRCGFSDGNYFKDVFKKTYGLSPREYRASRRKSGRESILKPTEDFINCTPCQGQNESPDGEI